MSLLEEIRRSVGAYSAAHWTQNMKWLTDYRRPYGWIDFEVKQES